MAIKSSTSSVAVCERCGAKEHAPGGGYYPPGWGRLSGELVLSAAGFTPIHGGPGSGADLDMCPVCVGEFKRWWRVRSPDGAIHL